MKTHLILIVKSEYINPWWRFYDWNGNQSFGMMGDPNGIRHFDITMGRLVIEDFG